jgi:L-galactose dehydrogenase
VFDFSPEEMEKCLDGSLARLRVDHVDILLAHDIEFAHDYEFVFEETAAVLHKLKRKGKCRFVGMSCYPLGLLRQAIEKCNLDVVISYCHFNLQNQQLLTELLPVVDRYGVGVLNASPLGMGLLTNQGPPPWHPAPEPVKAACRDAAKLCRDRGADISVLGMQYCFAEAQIPSTITGTAKKNELDVNLKALSTPIDMGLLTDVWKVLEPVRNQTWPSGNWVGR